MSVYQGSNRPIELDFDEPLGDIVNVSVTLCDYSGKVLLHKEQSDLIIQDNKIFLPVTQEETAKFPFGKAKVLVKWKSSDGYIDFAEEALIDIIGRSDRGVIL